VGRSVKLLITWSEWAEENPFVIPRPPSSYIENIFRIAKEVRMPMTDNMWKLHQSHVVPRSYKGEFPRDHFSVLLDILKISPVYQKVKQTFVLQQLETIAQATQTLAYVPSVFELESALETASVTGSSHDGTWLYQCLQDRFDAMDSSDDDTVSLSLARHLDLWFESICNDNKDEGALFYLENLLLHSNTDLSRRLQYRHYYNSFLRKIANSGVADSGTRAESFYLQWQRIVNATNGKWGPDEESVHAVVTAYLQGEAPRAVQLSQAQRFLASRQIKG
jgi:hypothetical protein